MSDHAPDDLDRALSDAERAELGRRFLGAIISDTIDRAWADALPPWLRPDPSNDAG